MNTQYPAGTGFDPRFQRPNGINVGGIGNLYAPQPQPEEEEGINPLVAIAGLAAAGGLGALGISALRGKGLNPFNRGKGQPPIDVVGVPVDPTPGPTPSQPGGGSSAPAADFSRPAITSRKQYDQAAVNRKANEAQAAYEKELTLNALKQGKPSGAARREPSTLQDVFGYRNYGIPTRAEAASPPQPQSPIPADLFSKRGSSPAQDYGNYITGIIRENGRNLDTVPSTGRIGNLFADLGSLTGVKKSEDVATAQMKAAAEAPEVTLTDVAKASNTSAEDFLAKAVSGVTDEAEEYVPVDPQSILNKGSSVPVIKKTKPIRYDSLDDVFERAIKTTEGDTYHIYKIDKDNNVAIGINPDTNELNAFEIVPQGGKFVAKDYDLSGHKDLIGFNAARRSELETIAQEQAEEAKQILAGSSPALTPEAPLPSGPIKVERLNDDEVVLPYPGANAVSNADKSKFFINAYSQQLGERVPILKPEVALAAAAEKVYNIPTELAQEIAKIPLGATEENLTSGQKGTLRQAYKYLDQSLMRMPAQVVLDNLEKGGLVAGDRKSAAPGMPGRTEVVEWTPGQTQLRNIGRRAPARYATSALERILRGTDGTVDYRYKFSIPGVDGAQGEFANANVLLDPLTVGFAPNPDTDQLVLISNQGQGSSVIPLRPFDRAPDEEVIGQTDSDVITSEDYKANIAPDPTIFQLAQIARTGRSLVNPASMVNNSKRGDKNLSGFKPLEIYPETAGGILQAIAAGKLKTSNPQKGAPVPFVKQSSRQTHNSGNLEAALTADQVELGNYAPGGLNKFGLKVDRERPPINDQDRQVGQEFLDLVDQMDISLLGDREAELLAKDGFDINPASPGAQRNAATLAALVRNINEASRNANAKGEEVNRIIQDGLSPTGVAIGRALPNLASISDFYGSGSQIDTSKSKFRTKGLASQDSIPATTQQLLLEDPVEQKIQKALADGEISEGDASIQAYIHRDKGNNLIHEAYRQALGYVSGPSKDAIDRVLQSYGTRSPIKTLTTSSGDVRKELERLQAPTAPIDASLTEEINEILEKLPPSFKVKSAADLRKKQTAQTAKDKRYKEQQRLKMRQDALDSIESGTRNKAEYAYDVEQAAAEELEAEMANRSVFDQMLELIRGDKDEELQKLAEGTTTKGRNFVQAFDDLKDVSDQIDMPFADADSAEDYIYGRPGQLPSEKRPLTETEKVLEQYLTGGSTNPIIVSSRVGRTVLSQNNDALDAAVRSRKVPDLEAIAAGATGDDATKWIGGSPLKPSPRTTFDYNVPVPVRTHWQDRAENDPTSIYGLGSQLGMAPNELFTAVNTDPDGLLFDLEERLEQNPGSIEPVAAKQLQEDPKGFMQNLMDQAKKVRDIQPNYSYQERGGVPARTAQQLGVNLALQRQGLPISNEIGDAVRASATKGYRWAGNSVLDLKGRIAADTLSDMGGTGSMKLRIARPDKEDAYYGEGKDPVGSYPPHTRLQRLYPQIRSGSTINENLPISEQLSRVAALTDEAGQPLLSAEQLQQLSQTLEREDRQLRPGAYGKPLSTVLPRERAEQQKEAQAQAKADQKEREFRSTLSAIASATPDKELSQIATDIELGNLAEGTVSSTVLGAINSILGNTPGTKVKLNPGTLQRTLKKAGVTEGSQVTALPQYETTSSGDSAVYDSPAVISDPYETIRDDEPSIVTEARRAAMRQQQNQTATDAINRVLLGAAAQLKKNPTQVPQVSARSAAQTAQAELPGTSSLLGMMDTTGMTPAEIASRSNQAIRRYVNRAGITPSDENVNLAGLGYPVVNSSLTTNTRGSAAPVLTNRNEPIATPYVPGQGFAKIHPSQTVGPNGISYVARYVNAPRQSNRNVNLPSTPQEYVEGYPYTEDIKAIGVGDATSRELSSMLHSSRWVPSNQQRGLGGVKVVNLNG